MKRYINWIIATTVLTVSASIANASLLDSFIPVTKLAETAKEITMAVMLKQFLDQYMPLIAILIVAIVAASCGISARRLLGDLADSYRDAVKDGRFTTGEKLFLIPLYVVGGIVAVGLTTFMLAFGWLAVQGAFGLMGSP